jgi:hypothetical protein
MQEATTSAANYSRTSTCWQLHPLPRPTFDRIPGGHPVARVSQSGSNATFYACTKNGMDASVPVPAASLARLPVARLWVEPTSSMVFPGQPVCVRWAVPTALSSENCCITVVATSGGDADSETSTGIVQAWCASPAALRSPCLVLDDVSGPTGEATFPAPTGAGAYSVRLIIGRRAANVESALADWAATLCASFSVILKSSQPSAPLTAGEAGTAAACVAVSRTLAQPRLDSEPLVASCQLAVINPIENALSNRSSSNRCVYALLIVNTLHDTKSTTKHAIRLPLGREDRISLLPASLAHDTSRPHLSSQKPLPVYSSAYFECKGSVLPKWPPPSASPTTPAAAGSTCHVGALVKVSELVKSSNSRAWISALKISDEEVLSGAAALRTDKPCRTPTPAFIGIVCFELGFPLKVPGAYKLHYVAESHRSLVSTPSLAAVLCLP